MYSDVLFELGMEELPSAAVKTLGDALCANIISALREQGIECEEAHSFATPRRLAVRFKMQSQQPDQVVVRQGPAYGVSLTADGQPMPALLGFARSCGVDISALEINETDKGKWWVYKKLIQGQAAKAMLPTLILKVVGELPISKWMRWGSGDLTFVRPVHWAVLLIDHDVIEMDILGCRTGRTSYGHRFHHPEAIEISAPGQYETMLEKAYVLVDFYQRREKIEVLVQQVAEDVDGVASVEPALLDEVASIVEWPVPLCVSFDKTFLDDVPAEALIAAMQVHQKCFPIYQRNSHQLLPYFVTVSNIKSHDPKQVIMGNVRVMHARLSDAAFFYRQDRKQTLSDYVVKTASVVFQEKLGSLSDKSKRIELLMQSLAENLNINRQDAERAAFLCKADLMTSMVGEFPELEGLMGYYYAQHDGESEGVTIALKEQYFPRFASDRLPNTVLARALSLADRLDTLVGIFAIGIKPTAVKDPFKLRRHALAVIRILKEMNVLSPLYLSDLLQRVADNYHTMVIKKEVLDELHRFILDRLPAAYQSDNISANLIIAVRKKQENCLFDFEQRLFALKTFFNREESEALSAACKRVDRLLQSVVLNDSDFLVDKRLLEKEVEKELLYRIERLEVKVKDYLTPSLAPTEKEYDHILSELANFRETVDEFFEQVMVMVDDIALKNNRLCLLARLQQLFQCVADISMLSH